MRDLVETGLKGETVLQDAIYFYITLMLNEWFVQAIEEPEQFKAIVQFVERPLDIRQKTDSEEFHYNVIYFEFSVKELKDLAGRELGNAQSGDWLSNFCFSISPDGEIEKVKLFKAQGDQWIWNEEAEKIQFDLFYPILADLFFENLNNKEEVRSKEQIKEEVSSVEDQLITKSRTDVEKQLHAAPGRLINIKNLIANYDVQQFVQKKVQKKTDEQYRIIGNKKLDAIWITICSVLDLWADQMAYLEVTSSLGDLCSGIQEGSSIKAALFLSNSDNKWMYRKDYIIYLLDLVERYRKEMKILLKNLENNNENFTINMYPENIEELRQNERILDFPLATSETNQFFLKNISSMEKLIEIEQKMDTEYIKIADGNKNMVSGKETLEKEITGFIQNMEDYEAQIKKIADEEIRGE